MVRSLEEDEEEVWRLTFVGLLELWLGRKVRHDEAM